MTRSAAPAPTYNTAASVSGPVSRSRILEYGALTPNSTAAPSARAAPLPTRLLRRLLRLARLARRLLHPRRPGFPGRGGDIGALQPDDAAHELLRAGLIEFDGRVERTDVGDGPGSVIFVLDPLID